MDTANLLVLIAAILFCVEMVLLGFATLFLVFLSLGLLVVATLVELGVIPDQVVEILIAITVSTALVSFVLYPFLKRLQNAKPTSEVESDFANIEFVLESATEQGEPPKYHYSGIDWRLRSKEPIVAGIKVRVVKKEVGVFWIEPVA